MKRRLPSAAALLVLLLAGCGSGVDLGSEMRGLLDRDPCAGRATVRHVLIGWSDLEPNYGGRMDDRAKIRSRASADELVADLLQRARGGADFPGLMREHSEDWATAETAKPYVVTPQAAFVAPFIMASLRLEPDEIGVVETVYGWHVIERLD